MDTADDGDAAGDNASYAPAIRPQPDAFFPFREASGPGIRPPIRPPHPEKRKRSPL